MKQNQQSKIHKIWNKIIIHIGKTIGICLVHPPDHCDKIGILGFEIFDISTNKFREITIQNTVNSEENSSVEHNNASNEFNIHSPSNRKRNK